MTTLAELVVKRKLVKDTRIANALIKAGLVKVGRAVIKNPEMPISEIDAISVLDERLAEKSLGYMRFWEIQREWSLFSKGQDVLCVGVDREEMSFLREMAKVRTKVLSVTNEKKVEGVFDVLVLSQSASVFNSLQLASRYVRFLSGRGKIVIKLRSKDARPLEDAMIRLANLHNLSLAGFLESRIEARNFWILLRPKSELAKASEKTFMGAESNFYRGSAPIPAKV